MSALKFPQQSAAGGSPLGLTEITRRLVAEFAPERIILFGSHAWGHPTPDSDIDLLVVVPESKLPPPRRAARAYRCLREVPVPLDILVRTRAEVEGTRHVPASLLNEIFERGRLLYG